MRTTMYLGVPAHCKDTGIVTGDTLVSLYIASVGSVGG